MLKKSQENLSQNFSCENCHYSTSKKSDYDKHLLTAKHKALTTINKSDVKGFPCSVCSKVYNSRVGLWCHKKKCVVAEPSNLLVLNPSATKVSETVEPAEKYEETFQQNNDSIGNIGITNYMIMQLFKENKEFRSMLAEQQEKMNTMAAEQQQKTNALAAEKFDEIKTLLVEKREEDKHDSKDMIAKIYEMTQQNLAITTNITNNTVNNNQRFNLNVFLNETCKDAMNLDEFLDTIRPTFDELLVMGDVGFVSGISDIFIKRLRALDITKRPIHCTDAKRETIFLKENNVWTKDDNGHSRLNSIIEKVEYRNVVCLHQWCLDNPDAMVNNHEKNLLRDKIYLQTLLGDPKTREKVVRNIAKEVALDREAIMLQFGRK